MSDPFLGQIQPFGFNFAPQGWARCDGQLLPIAQNTALFALLGTTYGGNGQTTFGLPDLRGRVSIHNGSGPGLSPRTIGENGGTESNTLNSNNLPAHNHGATLFGSAVKANNTDPTGLALGVADSNTYVDEPANVAMRPSVVTANTGSASPSPINNMQPFLTTNWCIALNGVFPSRG